MPDEAAPAGTVVEGRFPRRPALTPRAERIARMIARNPAGMDRADDFLGYPRGVVAGALDAPGFGIGMDLAAALAHGFDVGERFVIRGTADLHKPDLVAAIVEVFGPALLALTPIAGGVEVARDPARFDHAELRQAWALTVAGHLAVEIAKRFEVQTAARLVGS